MAKLSSGKTFAAVHKIYYSLENFCGASGRGHHVLYTTSDSRGKLSRSAEKLQKPRKFSHSKVLPYTVYFGKVHIYQYCPFLYTYICNTHGIDGSFTTVVS